MSPAPAMRLAVMLRMLRNVVLARQPTFVFQRSKAPGDGLVEFQPDPDPLRAFFRDEDGAKFFERRLKGGDCDLVRPIYSALERLYDPLIDIRGCCKFRAADLDQYASGLAEGSGHHGDLLYKHQRQGLTSYRGIG